MISREVLDEILPVPDLEELKDKKINELHEEGFIITNFNSGGIFYTLLMIVLKIRIELIQFLRSNINNMFLSHASGGWLDINAADFSKKRKKATKTQGLVTLYRAADADADAVKIKKGTVFKTGRDINGDELRFYAIDDAVIQRGGTQTDILVEAENTGIIYNIPPNQIIKSLTHIEGIDKISNKSNWITSEGSDDENDESLRSRALGAWSELSMRPTAAKYKNICESVEGVLYVEVESQHPRGQGTIDIIVTGTAGGATEALLEKVEEAALGIAGEYDNILVKSSVTVTQDISVIIILHQNVEASDIISRAGKIITEYMKISRNRNLNELLLIDLITALKAIESVKNIKFIEPMNDVELSREKVIILGNVDISIQ